MLKKMASDKEGWIYEEKEGDHRLPERLIEGNWSEEEFSVVPSGYPIAHAYDEAIVRVDTDQSEA